MPLTRVTVTLPADLVRGADKLARRRGTSRSAVMAAALASHLAASHGSPEPGRVAEPAPETYGTSLSDEALVAELRQRLAARTTTPPDSAPLDPRRPRVRFDRDDLAAVCRRHHVTRLSLFGSVLTDEFGPASDVDVLVEFARGHTPGLAIADLEDELSALFGGRRVDVVTERSLHRLLRDRVLASAVVQFAA
jgi:predicted nucleotidyltransferase